MPIISNKQYRSENAAKLEVFKKVCKHCLPHMAIVTLLPFVLILISMLLATLNAIPAAEFISYYVAFPLAVASPIICTVKLIFTFKDAFPRKTNDSHNVILSALFCSSLCTVATIVLFNQACALFGAFPLDFKAAAYMRDMFSSSAAAMIIFYFTVFIFFTFVSLMILASYFIGDRSKKRYKFTFSCTVFLLFYIIFLILLITCYFISTFLDITALENIQIAQSIFNSSVLCIFVTFDVLALICSPILYFLNLKFLNKKSN